MKIIKQEDNDPIEVLIHKDWINLDQDSLHGIFLSKDGAKQLIEVLAELLEKLEVVGDGGTVQSDDEIIAELSQKLADCQDGNNQLRAESDKYFNELNEAQNAGIKALESYGIVQKQLTQTQKYLLEANQEVEQIESKYRFVLIFNYVLSLVILGIVISWVLI